VHDDGCPDCRFVKTGSDAKVNFLEKAQSSDTFETMAKCRIHFSEGFSPVRDADTLHVVGSYHDPTTCKVSPETIDLVLTFWPFGALTGPASAPMAKHRIHFSERLVDGAVGSCHEPTACNVS
jgi:hypothetical protein